MLSRTLVDLPESTLREQELIARVDWFIQLRWLAVGSTLVALFFLWHLFEVRFPLSPVLGTTLAIFLYNAIFALVAQYLRERGMPTVRAMRIFANVQVVADLVCLTALVHFFGGIESYFVVFYFFHMAIASILLRRLNAYSLALLAALLLNGMIWGEHLGIVPHYHYESILGPSRIASFKFNLLSVAILTFSLFMSVYFASTIASRLRQREVEIESAYGDLKRIDEEKSYFMRRASHELRSPLTAILSLIHLLRQGLKGPLNEEQQQLLQRVEGRLKGLLELERDLLRFSKLRVLERLPAVEYLDFSQVVQNVFEVLSPWAEERGVQLELHVQPAMLCGEEESLQEVAANLISNGIKYTPPGGRVAIEVEVDEERVHFSVKDTGIGIDERDQSRIFSEFFRARNAKELTQSGTGLGLAIAKRIVEMHGGHIAFTSQLGKGTCFEVELPLAGEARSLSAKN